jgi:hypothetical protein
VDADGVVAVVENGRLDRSFRNELQTERTTLRERISALSRQDGELALIGEALRARSEEFRSARMHIIDRAIAQAEAAVRASDAQLAERSGNLARRRDLFKAGYASRAVLDEAAASERTAQEQVQRDRLAIERLKAERAAIENGVFVDASQNDVPYSLQRIDEISLRRQDLQARIREYEIRVGEIEHQMAAEDARLDRASTTTQRAPVHAVVWQKSVAQGSDVVIGGELVQLLDCEHLFLEVMLDESHFDAIHPGHPAEVQLVGADSVLRGRVQSVRGNASVARDTHAVARLEAFRDDHFTVTVAVDGDQLAGGDGGFCNVGRKARVSFERHRDGLAATFAGWFDVW